LLVVAYQTGLITDASNALHHQMAQYRDKIDSLQLNLSNARSEHQEKAKEYQRQREELLEARVKLESATQQLASTRTQLADTESRINMLLSNKKAGGGNNAELASSQLQQQLEIVQAQVTSLREELISEKEHTDHYKVRVSQFVLLLLLLSGLVLLLLSWWKSERIDVGALVLRLILGHAHRQLPKLIPKSLRNFLHCLPKSKKPTRPNSVSLCSRSNSSKR
jgi:hypothetical protein